MEIVIQDHVILRRGLDILDEMIRTMEAGRRIEIINVTALLEFFRIFGVDYHQTIVEDVVFPAVSRAALQQMRAEHEEQKTLISEVETALRFRRGSDFVRASRRFGLLLRNHLHKEELILRGVAEHTLSSEQDVMLTAEITKIRKQAEPHANLTRLGLCT